MPRVGFTLRGMMVAVAITGLVFGVVVAVWRAFNQYAVIAAQCRDREGELWGEIPRLERLIATDSLRSRQVRELDPGFADYLLAGVREAEARITTAREEMLRQRIRAEKYERAARYPWLAVSPEPK